MTLADVEPWAGAIHKALFRMQAPAEQPLVLECIREDGARAVFAFGPETPTKHRPILERVA